MTVVLVQEAAWCGLHADGADRCEAVGISAVTFYRDFKRQ
jgi:hypothetical protein